MNIVTTIISATGGVIIFLSALVVTIRSIFKQIGATEKNTEAVQHLSAKLDRLGTDIIGHEHRITILEERMKAG